MDKESFDIRLDVQSDRIWPYTKWFLRYLETNIAIVFNTNSGIVQKVNVIYGHIVVLIREYAKYEGGLVILSGMVTAIVTEPRTEKSFL